MVKQFDNDDLNTPGDIDEILKNAMAEAESNEHSAAPEVTHEDTEEDPKVEVVDDEVHQEQQEHHQEEDLEEQQRKREIRERKKASRLQREKYQLAEAKRQYEAEVLRLQKENEYLRTQQETSSQAALFHNENSLNIQKTSLIDQYKKAADVNDSEVMAQVTADIAKVQAELDRINHYKTQAYYAQQQQQLYNQQYNQYDQYQQQYNPYDQPQEVELNDETVDWAERNPWFIPGNPSYDQRKVEETKRFTQQLDQFLIDNGRQHEFASEEYFNAIDNHLNNVFGPKNSVPLSQQFSSSRSQAPVAPVRRSAPQGAPSSPSQVRLTAEEKMLARNLGVSPQAFAKEKLINERRIEGFKQRGDIAALTKLGQVRI